VQPPLRRNSSLREALASFLASDEYWTYPVGVHAAFQSVVTWFPPRHASLPIVEINASFAKMLRDKAGRERGYKFGNYALLLLQAIIKAAVDAGALSTNRMKQVPRLLPPRRQLAHDRRPIKSPRRPAGLNSNSARTRSSSA
jgi:hypothetical protein